MTPEEKAEIVRAAYESYTHEPWVKCGRQEHWENLVDEVNRRPHLTGCDVQEEHVRRTYYKVMLGRDLEAEAKAAEEARLAREAKAAEEAKAANEPEIMLGKVTAPIKVDVSEAKPKPKKS